MAVVLVMAFTSQRDEDAPTDYDAIWADVQTLSESCKGKGDRSKHRIMEIFLQSSTHHLTSVIARFGEHSQSLSSVIKKSKTMYVPLPATYNAVMSLRSNVDHLD
jgi:hypothetical protein